MKHKHKAATLHPREDKKSMAKILTNWTGTHRSRLRHVECRVAAHEIKQNISCHLFSHFLGFRPKGNFTALS